MPGTGCAHSQTGGSAWDQIYIETRSSTPGSSVRCRVEPPVKFMVTPAGGSTERPLIHSDLVADPGLKPTLSWPRAEIAEYAEREACELLGVGADEAFAMLDQGKLRGTMLDVEFTMLRMLMEG